MAKAPFRRAFGRSHLDKGLWILRGPRQVGKSSWLKHLLAKYKDPTRAFYQSCENISDYKELAALLAPLRTSRSLILLDEVTFVKEWQRAIKHEIDAGYDGTMVVTGSHASDLRRGGELLPGRFGKGRELVLLPMGFHEFVGAREAAGWRNGTHKELLQMYFRCGGFPSAVTEAGADGGEVPIAKDTYRRWLLGDALRLGKQELYLRELLGQVALTLGSSISLQKLAQRTQFGSHHTAQEYVQLLEDCFAIRTLYAIDMSTHALHLRRERKLYFSDPLLFWLALDWAGYSPPRQAEDLLAEMVAHETLFRAAEQKQERMGYVRSPKGEIDFVGRKSWAVEVKWPSSTHNLSKAYKEAAIADKRVWNELNLLDELPAVLSQLHH